MTELKHVITAINDGKFGLKTTVSGDVDLTRSGREWVYFWSLSKQPVDIRPALLDMAEEIAEARKIKAALIELSICSLTFGKLLGFHEREDSEGRETDAAWELLADVIEPVVQAGDEAEDGGIP